MADKKTGGMPPPIDPDHVQEIAADEVLTVETGGGMTTLVFGKRRLVEQGAGRPPRIERHVKSRLVLSDAAVNEMMHRLIALSQACRTLNNPPPGKDFPTAH
jgi:hypothetical protein